LGSMHWTVHQTIHHGPFPQLRTAALAVIDSELQLPPALRQQVSSVLHGQPLLAVHTTLGFSGGSTATLQSPAFEYRTPDGASVTWRGVSGTVRATRGMAAWSGTVAAPGLTLAGPQGSLELLGFDFSAHMQRALDAFSVGQSAFRVATIALHPTTGGTPFSVEGMALQGDTALDGDYLDEHATLSADRVNAAQFSLSNVDYALRLDHLDAASFAALINALRSAQQAPLDNDARHDAARANVELFRRYGFEMALHEPVLEIERIGFVTPEGQFRLSAKLALPGLRREQLQGPGAVLALLQHLDARADLRVDAALLAKFVEASSKRELISAQLQQLERQGYLRRDGGSLSTSLIFRAGALTINGQPFRPLAAAAATVSP
jgi:uncharacterized protein YdgA (DUF945 family)